jgi:WD40 repeat protein/tetratricopeptide (TPR) repeat protein
MGMGFDGEGRRLAIPSSDEGVQIWRLGAGRQLGLPLPHAGRVQLATVRADGKTLVTASPEVQRWDTSAGRPVGRPVFVPALERPLAFSPSGDLLATSQVQLGSINPSSIYGFGAGPVAVHLWDTATGKPVGPALPHQVAVYAAAFSADGRTLATASGPQTTGAIRLWDVATGKQRGTGIPYNGPVVCLAFSPDGKWLVTGTGTAGLGDLALESQGATNEGHAEVWDLARRERVGRPLFHRGRVIAVAFSPDGKAITTGSEDGTARLWDAQTGRPLHEPWAHDGPVSAVRFSRDGRFVLTGSDDRAARLWDVQTGQLVGLPMPHAGAVTALAFSPDGSYLVTGGQDRTVRLWRMPKPLPGTPAAVLRRVEAATGMRLNAENAARPLDLAAWNARVQELTTAAEPAVQSAAAAGDWHVHAALDALEGRDWQTAAWHLDQHLHLHPDAWLAYALRSRADRGLARTVQADRDWDEAVRRGPRDAVLRWFNWLALQGLEKGGKDSLVTAAWYIEHLTAVWPKDWSPHPGWARVYALRAQEHVAAARWKEAAADYDQATTFYPGDPQLWEEKGRFHIAREHWLAAADAFDRALSLVPIELSQHSARSRFCNELAHWPKTLDRLLELRPHDSQLWVARARYRARQSKWDAAVADYRRTDQDRPVSEEFLEQACALLIVGDQAGYRDLCRRLAERAGANPDPFTAFVLARTCSAGPDALADPQRAVHWGEQAVSSVANPPGWYLHALGMACFRAGQPERALQVLTRPWHPMNSLALAMIHHRLGHAVPARGHWNNALFWLRTQQPASPDEPVAALANDWLEFHALRLEAERVLNAPGRREAEDSLQRQRWAEAVHFLDQLIAADPASWTDRVRRSCALAELGRRAEANAEFARATALLPRSPRPLLMRGRFYLDLGKLKEADADIAAALRQTESQPDDLEVLLGLGSEVALAAETAVENGHAEQGLAWWTQAAGVYRRLATRFADTKVGQDGLAQTLFSLARLQRRLHRPAEAMHTAEEIRERWPRNPSHLYNAACEMALCVGMVGEGKEEQTRRKYTEEALATLRQAVRAGYRDFVHMRQDTDFAAIRAAVDAEQFESPKEEETPR